MKDKKRNGLLPQECIAQMDALGFEWAKPSKSKPSPTDTETPPEQPPTLQQTQPQPQQLLPQAQHTHEGLIDEQRPFDERAFSQHIQAATLGLHLLQHATHPPQLSLASDMPHLQELQQVLGVQLPQGTLDVSALILYDRQLTPFL